jgi:hypothetical protein
MSEDGQEVNETKKILSVIYTLVCGINKTNRYIWLGYAHLLHIYTPKEYFRIPRNTERPDLHAN